MNLSNATNATIADPQGQGSITDEDGIKLAISQIYGGGGNASATYTNDFIEIFNRGNTAVSLNGMSVQYAAATSTTGNYQVTALPNVMLQPGQYFLIQEASGGAIGIRFADARRDRRPSTWLRAPAKSHSLTAPRRCPPPVVPRRHHHRLRRLRHYG